MSKAERTRQFIIEKAALVLNKKGIAGTSISDIMEATQLAKGGIYGNFENKDEICLEAFNFLSANLSARIDARLADKTTPRDKLFAILDYHRDTLLANNSGGCPILNFGTEADDTNPRIKEKVGEAIKRSQARIAACITDGIGNGDFRESVNAREFAIKMFTMIEGGLLASKVFGSIEQLQVVIRVLKAEIETFNN